MSEFAFIVQQTIPKSSGLKPRTKIISYNSVVHLEMIQDGLISHQGASAGIGGMAGLLSMWFLNLQ